MGSGSSWIFTPGAAFSTMPRMVPRSAAPKRTGTPTVSRSGCWKMPMSSAASRESSSTCCTSRTAMLSGV